MGYGGYDDLISEVSDGKIRTADGAKTTSPAHTAGGWHLLAGLGGSPVATTFPGTDLVWSACDEANGDGTSIFGIQHGGPVDPDTKHVLSMGALMVAAAGAPWVARLVDVQGYYRLSTTNVTGTGSRALINSETFTADAGTDLLTHARDWKPGTVVRFSSTTTLPAPLVSGDDYWLIRVSATTARVAASYADYVDGTYIDITDAGTGTHTLSIRPGRGAEGCQAMFVVQTQPTGGGPNLSASSYTNSDGTTARAFSGSPTMGATADAYATRIIHSGNASGRYGPFLPLASGDKGVRSIESFTLSGGTAYTGSGVLALAIVKPIGRALPLPVTGMYTERDFVNQLPSLPQIREGACLSWLLFSTGATTNLSPFAFDLDFGWG